MFVAGLPLLCVGNRVKLLNPDFDDFGLPVLYFMLL